MRYLKATLALAVCVAGLGLLTACSGVKFQTFPAPSGPVSSLPDNLNPKPSLPAGPATTPPGGPKATAPAKPPEHDYGPPVVTDTKKMAQDLVDDERKNFGTYAGKNLEITGVIVSQTQLSGAPIAKDTEGIGQIEFKVQVTDKAGAKKDYSIYSRFKEEFKPGTPTFTALAKGKTVTVRGHMTGGGKDSATLNDCVFVK